MCRSQREVLEHLAELKETLAGVVEGSKRIEQKVDTLMSQESTEQAQIDSVTATLTAEDTDIKNLASTVANAQAALDIAITNLQNTIADGGQPDLTELLAAQSVLAGDQPNLDAAVAALAADPAITPATPPASS